MLRNKKKHNIINFFLGCIQLHFLIIDDVMTTGTTLEICALALLEVYPKAKISVATLAFADLW